MAAWAYLYKSTRVSELNKFSSSALTKLPKTKPYTLHLLVFIQLFIQKIRKCLSWAQEREEKTWKHG